jgi:hypothetical protein
MNGKTLVSVEEGDHVAREDHPGMPYIEAVPVAQDGLHATPSDAQDQLPRLSGLPEQREDTRFHHTARRPHHLDDPTVGAGPTKAEPRMPWLGPP